MTIAKRPSVLGRDGEGYAGDLRQKGTGIFLRRGLDDPNHVDPTGEFSLNAHPGGLGRLARVCCDPDSRRIVA